MNRSAMEQPKRTGETGRTGDELLLFDFMFDKSVAFHAMRVEPASSLGVPEHEFNVNLEDRLEPADAGQVLRDRLPAETIPAGLWRD